MLVENMTLRNMVDFKPSDLDMAMLSLEVTVYIKASVISLTKEDNYNFIRFLFSHEISEELYKMNETVIYDFDGTNTDQEKVVSIFELYSTVTYENISDYFKEILEEYTHEADVIIDFYTHDSREYRLSNLDGIVKLEEITK